MKKTLLMLLAVIAAFHFTSCRKIIDQIQHNPEPDFQSCDIKKFKIWVRDSYNEYTVYYNKNGQPTDVIGTYPNQKDIFSNDQHFRYDNKGRVTDWINNPPGTKKVFQWETYHYLSSTRVLDSIYELNNVSGSYITDKHPKSSPDVFVITRIIDYDSYGRAIKITTLKPTSSVQNIVYDAKGNSNLNEAYDNNINLMRTNKVWMFTNINYNTNNFTKGPFSVVYTYNSYGLPTVMELAPETRTEALFWGWSFVFHRMAIEYDCKDSPKYYY